MDLTDKQKARLFDALHADGVDNWEGYKFEQGNYEAELKQIEIENKFEAIRNKMGTLIEIIETNIDVDYPAEREAGMRTKLTELGIDEVANWITENYKLFLE